jgi:CRP-like cAMP-binding protein
MVDRDFFGFCITLKPLELKAIGELSETRHLAAGETIYAPGDPGEAFFIINRGVVEAVRGSAKKVSDTYLSRGDIFGDVEVLTERPRKYLVRTREPVSLQCFHRADFPELVKRVPSFFQYLSEQLAFRLAQARDLTLGESQCLELSGSLSNFDLVTVYQTIINSSQTGELRISNANSQLISAFYFEKGQPRCGQFEHLTGEEAFSQLFLSEALAGTFSFSSGDRAIRAGMQAEEITRNPDEMLINALQGRDELTDLKHRMSDNSAILHRRRSNLAWPASAKADLRPVAEEIWNLVDDERIELSTLLRQCSFNELKVYQAIDQLVESQYLDLSSVGAGQKVA